MSSEKQESWLSRTVTCASLMIAIGALVVSYLAYRHSKIVDELQRTTQVQLEAEIFWKNVYFDGFRPKPRFVKPDGSPPREVEYYGLDFFVITRVYNESAHAITVDGAWCTHIVNHMIAGEEIESFQCYVDDLQTEREFPALVKPYEQLRFFIKIWWPVSEEIVRVYRGLEPNKLYSWKEMFDIYEKSLTKPLHLNATPPERAFAWLVTDRFVRRSSDGTPESHWFRVVVKLASGEYIRTNIHH